MGGFQESLPKEGFRPLIHVTVLICLCVCIWCILRQPLKSLQPILVSIRPFLQSVHCILLKQFSNVCNSVYLLSQYRSSSLLKTTEFNNIPEKCQQSCLLYDNLFKYCFSYKSFKSQSQDVVNSNVKKNTADYVQIHVICRPSA